MKVTRQEILEFLQERQRISGGFTGQDITQFASKWGLNSHTFRRRIQRLLANNTSFQGLIYLGQRTPSLNLDDHAWIGEAIEKYNLATPKVLIDGLNQRRIDFGLPRIPERTAYRAIERMSIGLARDRIDPFTWFHCKDIPVAQDYSIEEARRALLDLFTYRQLTTPRGLSLRKTLTRIQDAEKWFQTHHPEVSPHDHYDALRTRTQVLPALLASIRPDRMPAVQARLCFESSVIFLVEARDFFLSQVRFRRGRFQQAINAGLKGEQCRLLQERIDRNKQTIWTEISRRKGPDREVLEQLAREPDRELDLAKANLRLRRSEAYNRLFGYLAGLTKDFHPDEITYHNSRADVLLCLARNEMHWSDLTPDHQKALGKNRCLLDVVDKEAKRDRLLSILLTERLIDLIHHGNLTLSHSWEYQDLGRLVNKTSLPSNEAEWPLSREVLDLLITGQYQVDLGPLKRVVKGPLPAEDTIEEEEAEKLFERENFSTMALEVHGVIRRMNPNWFHEHGHARMEAWDGCFRMEYTEEEFARKLLSAIGFLGRNCRYRDDPAFRHLEYFIRRYVTPATLETELRFHHRTLAMLTGTKEDVLLTDTVGIEGRRTHALATYHPRYHTLGLADLRGIGGRMIPAYSLPCSSRETEAMHAVELVARANRVLDGELRLYSGNGHTVSMVSAGLLFGTFGVISAGHMYSIPKTPRPLNVKRLKKHLDTMNRVFLLLRQRPELGRLFCARTHIYSDGVNVRKLLESLGRLIIRAVSKEDFSARSVQPYIEASNRQKRLVRIFERGVTRAQPHHHGLYLMAAEIILAMAAIRSCMKMDDATKEEISIGLDSIALFRPV